MKSKGTAMLALAASVLLGHPSLSRAQAPADEKPKAEVHSEKVTPLKIQVVLTEFDGNKKVMSLPYVSCVDTDRDRGNQLTKLRVGNKVPVYIGKDAASAHLEWYNVGTSIDYRAWRVDPAVFRLELIIEREWVEDVGPISALKQPAEDRSQFNEPVIHEFRNEFELSLRDGQTTEATVATDPVSGKVTKIAVTLWVLK
jgi:hypothetical protein